MKMIVLVKLNEYERIDENELRKDRVLMKMKMNYEFKIREGELWLTDEMNYEFTIREGEFWMTDEMN